MVKLLQMTYINMNLCWIKMFLAHKDALHTFCMCLLNLLYNCFTTYWFLFVNMCAVVIKECASFTFLAFPIDVMASLKYRVAFVFLCYVMVAVLVYMCDGF